MVKTYLVGLGFSSLVLVSACKNDDDLLLGFDQICLVRAENICSVRVPPCCSEDSRAPDCIEQETNTCETELNRIAGLEGDLMRYHARHAAESVDAELTELEQCQPPRPLPSFFDGVLAEGEACKRDTQCVTGSCGDDSGVCESASEMSLCPEHPS